MSQTRSCLKELCQNQVGTKLVQSIWTRGWVQLIIVAVKNKWRSKKRLQLWATSNTYMIFARSSWSYEHKMTIRLHIIHLLHHYTNYFVKLPLWKNHRQRGNESSLSAPNQNWSIHLTLWNSVINWGFDRLLCHHIYIYISSVRIVKSFSSNSCLNLSKSYQTISTNIFLVSWKPSSQ